jgi:hypothetical protein
MSTIHHPVQHHTGLYVAAAAIVLAGLLAALVAAVFWLSNASDGTSPASKTGQYALQQDNGPNFREVCHAGRPGASIELTPACAGAR